MDNEQLEQLYEGRSLEFPGGYPLFSFTTRQWSVPFYRGHLIVFSWVFVAGLAFGIFFMTWLSWQGRIAEYQRSVDPVEINR